ncbi:MAG: alpha/beta hydrolase [Rhodobacteraceae bacterium]|nr:MAG: alpha/beta hydrolase [Paracoccaceae bacterium]
MAELARACSSAMPAAMAPGLPEPEIHMLHGLRCLFWRQTAVDAPALVLLHGMGDGADTWRASVAHLRALHAGAIIALDLPGHWGSDWQEDGHYQLHQTALRVARVIADLTVGPVHLVGHSLGGCIAAYLACQRMATLNALVLVDTTPERDPDAPGSQAVQAHIDALNEPPFDAARLAAIAASRLPLGDAPALASYFDAATKTLPAGARRYVDLSALDFDMSVDGVEVDFNEIFAAIGCPVGFVRGAFSSLLSARVAHGAALAVQNCCGYHTIAQAGHALMLEQPQAVAHAIARCLQDAAPAGGGA